MIERRRIRILAAKEAVFRGAEGEVRAVLDNISLKGCLAQVGTDQGLPQDSNVELIIRLDPSNPEFDIRVLGKVIRREVSVVAVDFHELSPESFHHLLRFVQYNAEDPEAIERELGRSAYNPEEKEE
jgi:hypothetical protein